MRRFVIACWACASRGQGRPILDLGGGGALRHERSDFHLHLPNGTYGVVTTVDEAGKFSTPTLAAFFYRDSACGK